MKRVYLKYLFNDHQGEEDLDGSIISGIHKELQIYRKDDPDVEYIIVNPFRGFNRDGKKRDDKKRGDGMDD